MLNRSLGSAQLRPYEVSIGRLTQQPEKALRPREEFNLSVSFDRRYPAPTTSKASECSSRRNRTRLPGPRLCFVRSVGLRPVEGRLTCLPPFLRDKNRSMAKAVRIQKWASPETLRHRRCSADATTRGNQIGASRTRGN
jgi:hypothetical protein